MMAKQTFTTGQVLTAAQMTSLQQTAMFGGAASAKTANYVLVAADAGTAISMTSTSATTITVNTGLFAAGDTVFIQNLGSGTCTITAGTATVNTAGSLALPQYDAGILYFVSASSAIFYDYIQSASSGNKTIALVASGSFPAASSLNLTGITQDYLQLQIFGLQWNSGQSRIQIQVNSNTGSIYRQTSFSNISGGGDQINGLSTQIDLNTAATYNAYGDTWYSIIIQNCATTGFKNYSYLQFSKNTANNYFITGAGQGVIETSVALTSIQVINSNAYNYNAGTYRLVGG